MFTNGHEELVAVVKEVISVLIDVSVSKTMVALACDDSSNLVPYASN